MTARVRILNVSLLALLFLLLVVHLRHYFSGMSEFFDDSYMFDRYAVHFRHGLGWSWNAGGTHTYGQTSLTWSVVVLLLSFLPLSVSHMLVLGSWLTGVAALVVMAHAVSWNAQSRYFSSAWRVLVLVGIPMATCGIYKYHEITGMDTMLGVVAVAAYTGMVLAWSKGKCRAEWVGLAGGLAFLTRPESVIVVVLLPAMAYWLLRERATLRELMLVLGTFAGVVLADLVVAKIYFHTALPLSFYMKSRHAYEGYAGRWLPASSAVAFFGSSCLFLLTIACCARKKDFRLLAVCAVPLALTVLALCRVTQIMGMSSRYYVPYFALIVVPALLLLDRRVAEREQAGAANGGVDLVLRYGLAFVAISLLQPKFPGAAFARIDQMFEGKRVVYAETVRAVDASRPLPGVGPTDAVRDVTELVQVLPRGATSAATEVGYLGAMAPQVSVIDLAGLNDTEIALNGFDAERFYARKPDIIWFPHVDYTYQRGLMFTSPTLLRDYMVIDGAENYGLAIRKDSPYEKQLLAGMQSLWKKRYDGYAMKDYEVRSVTWDKSTHVLPLSGAAGLAN